MKPSVSAFWPFAALALAVGLVAQDLLRVPEFGLNLAGLVVLFGLGLALLARKQLVALRAWSRLLLIPVLGGALGLAFNDSQGLDALNIGMIVFALGLIGVIESGVPIRLLQLFVSPWMVSFAPIGGLLGLGQVEWKGSSDRKLGRRLGQGALGLLLSFPFLLVFGGLLMSADPIFMKTLLNVRVPEALGTRAMVFVTLTLGTMGVLYAFAPKVRQLLNPIFFPPRPPIKTNSAVLEPSFYAGFLGAFAMLFLAFFAMQSRYLFGGNDFVLRAEGLTYAEYARRGFFEIMTVISLALPVALATLSLAPANARLVRWSAWSLGAGLFGLLFSAAWRMSLYVGAYGLSPLRFYVSAAMVWFTIILIAFALWAVRGRLVAFGVVTLASAFGLGLMLNGLRPDRVIARYNLARAGQTLDPGTLVHLGADAWPVLRRTSLGDKWQAQYRKSSRFKYGLSWSEIQAMNHSWAGSGSLEARAETSGRPTVP